MLHVILTLPIRYDRVEGSVVRSCCVCGQPVWVAPSSMPALESGAKPACLACFMGANLRRKPTE